MKPTPAELEAALRLMNVPDAMCYRPSGAKPVWCLRGTNALRAISSIVESYQLELHYSDEVFMGTNTDVAFAFIHADHLDLER